MKYELIFKYRYTMVIRKVLKLFIDTQKKEKTCFIKFYITCSIVICFLYDRWKLRINVYYTDVDENQNLSQVINNNK